MSKSNLTQKELKSIFYYDPETGIFTRKIKLAQSSKTGEIVGVLTKSRHLKAAIRNKEYYLHRLAWFYMTGSWPKDQIDHINQNPGDNRFCNLRGVNNQENNKNQSLRITNKSGFTGINWDKETSKWTARIMINYKTLFLGCYEGLDDAIEARKEANIKYGFHANHGMAKGAEVLCDQGEQ